MSFLAISRRWHRARVATARFLENRVLFPAWIRVRRAQKKSSDALNDQDAKARLRWAVCSRCPLLTRVMTCRACGCFMPVKVQIDKAACPKGKW